MQYCAMLQACANSFEPVRNLENCRMVYEYSFVKF